MIKWALAIVLLVPEILEGQVTAPSNCLWYAVRGANTQIARREQWWTAWNDLKTYETRNPTSTEALRLVYGTSVTTPCTINYRRQGAAVSLIETVPDTVLVVSALRQQVDTVFIYVHSQEDLSEIVSFAVIPVIQDLPVGASIQMCWINRQRGGITSLDPDVANIPECQRVLGEFIDANPYVSPIPVR